MNTKYQLFETRHAAVFYSDDSLKTHLLSARFVCVYQQNLPAADIVGLNAIKCFMLAT